MRAVVLLAILLGAAPAPAETFVWRDADGNEHFTDDPSTVPDEARATLRTLDGADASLSVIGPSPGEAAGPSDAELLARENELRRTENLKTEMKQAIDGLQRRLADAQREARKYAAGGRIGAAEAAARAKELVAELEAQLAGKEKELAALLGRLGLERPSAEEEP